MTNLPETISVAELADEAGRPRRGEIRQGTDDIDDLRKHIFEFCASQGAPTAALSSARTKFEEGIFWLRSHRSNPGG